MNTCSKRRTWRGAPALLTAAVLVGLLTPSLQASAAPKAGAAALPKHIYGFNLSFYDYGWSNQVLRFDAGVTAEWMKAEGANTAVIVIPFYIPSLTSNLVESSSWTPTASRVGIVASELRSFGLNVILRPLADERNLKPSWRGAVHPASPSVWFANYLKFLKPYLQVAQTDKVGLFEIASELQGTYKTNGWSALFTKARTYFKGELEVSGSWGNGATVAFKGVTSGIDTYLGIKASPTASPATVLADWNANLKKHPFPSKASSTIISEVGIAAQDGAYAEPNVSQIGASEPIDPNIQANWFYAACTFAQQHKTMGLFFWKLDFGTSLTTQPTSTDPTLLSSKAVAVIKTCFKTYAKL